MIERQQWKNRSCCVIYGPVWWVSRLLTPHAQGCKNCLQGFECKRKACTTLVRSDLSFQVSAIFGSGVVIEWARLLLHKNTVWPYSSPRKSMFDLFGGSIEGLFLTQTWRLLKIRGSQGVPLPGQGRGWDPVSFYPKVKEFSLFLRPFWKQGKEFLWFCRFPQPFWRTR